MPCMGTVRRAAIVVALVVFGGIVTWFFRSSEARLTPASGPVADGTMSTGPGVDLFDTIAIGDSIRPNERPEISNVQIADLDRDGLADVLVCDITRKQVSWIRQSPKGTFIEQRIGTVAAPAHVT